MSALSLLPGEKVVAVGRPALVSVWPRYLLTLGLYGFWHKRRVAVVTDKRLLLGKGLLSRREHSIPMSHISDALYFRRGLAGFCEVTSSNEWSHNKTTVGPLPTGTARLFVHAVQSFTSLR